MGSDVGFFFGCICLHKHVILRDRAEKGWEVRHRLDESKTLFNEASLRLARRELRIGGTLPPRTGC